MMTGLAAVGIGAAGVLFVVFIALVAATITFVCCVKNKKCRTCCRSDKDDVVVVEGVQMATMVRPNETANVVYLAQPVQRIGTSFAAAPPAAPLGPFAGLSPDEADAATIREAEHALTAAKARAESRRASRRLSTRSRD